MTKMSNVPRDLAEEELCKIPMKTVRSKKHLGRQRKKLIIADLPMDLAEEVLSRVPVRSLRSVGSTFKKWNTLSRAESFAKKHLSRHAKVETEQKEFMVVMMMNFRVYLMSVNLDVDPCIKPEGKLISPDKDNQVEISDVFHCDGLLLCITKDLTRLLLWNPYWGQTRWIEPTNSLPSFHHRGYRYSYALGYGETRRESCRSYKVLRFIDYPHPEATFLEFKIYDFDSDSWRVLDISPDWWIQYYCRGVSLKGNTYWFATEKVGAEYSGFLICFDFKREKFGERLSLPPFVLDPSDVVSLSIVREEQLAVLFQEHDTLRMEVWVTTKIEPDTVSWNHRVFLDVSMRPHFAFGFHFSMTCASFYIDEEKKVAVVFDKDLHQTLPTRDLAYIVGVDGSLKEVHLAESPDVNCHPLSCPYAPSLVQL